MIKNKQDIIPKEKNPLITETDKYFSDPEIKNRIVHSIEQADRGELLTLLKEDIKKYMEPIHETEVKVR
jgi:hypothetical protein